MYGRYVPVYAPQVSRAPQGQGPGAGRAEPNGPPARLAVCRGHCGRRLADRRGQPVPRRGCSRWRRPGWPLRAGSRCPTSSLLRRGIQCLARAGRSWNCRIGQLAEVGLLSAHADTSDPQSRAEALGAAVLAVAMPRRPASRPAATANAATGSRTPQLRQSPPAAALPRFPATAGRGRGGRPRPTLSATRQPGP